MGNIYVDQDHNLNKILNADLTEIEPLYLHPDVLVPTDVLGIDGITVTDNLDGTITIGGGGGAAGYRETFTLVDPVSQLPLTVNHLLGVASGVVDVTVAKIGPPTRLVEAEITIISDNLLEVDLPGAQPGDYEVVVITEGPGGVTTTPPVPLKVWDPVVTYQPADQVLWPATRPSNVWDAQRVTLDDEPGVAEPDVPILTFPGSVTAGVGEGLSAPVVFAFPDGFDVQVRTSGADNVSEGTLVSVTDLMTDLPIFTFGVDSTSVKLEIRTVSFGTALQPFYLPRTNFDLLNRPCLRLVVSPTEATFYDSVDGKVWENRGATPFPEALYLAGVTKVRIAHDTFDELRSYSGGLGAVTILDPAGVPLASWDPATQGVDGVGISPVTGEEYTKVGTGVFTPGVVQDPAAWVMGLPGTGPVVGNEVHIGGDDPRLDPRSKTELWYDVDAVAMQAPPEIPAGGAAGAPLVKASATDRDIRWGGDVFMSNDAIIDFPNQADKAKVILYGDTTTGFGLGITSGTMNLFASSTIKFQANSITGAEWANFSASGLGPRNTYAVTYQNSFTGTMDFRVNPAMVTLRISDLKCGSGISGGASKKICDYPAGVPAPWGALRFPTPQRSSGTGGYFQNEFAVVEAKPDGVYLTQMANEDLGGDYYFDATITWAR